MIKTISADLSEHFCSFAMGVLDASPSDVNLFIHEDDEEVAKKLHPISYSVDENLHKYEWRVSLKNPSFARKVFGVTEVHSYGA